MPKISVLMPVYKTPETYLREAIESVLTQSFADFEFLILDDCPEHPVEEIVKSYKDERIKYVQNEKNMGITPSRNKLIDMARGEYLAVLDHDDVCLPDRFEKEAAYLDAHQNVGVVSCRIEQIPSGKISDQPQDDKSIKLALMRYCVIMHSASMIRKSVLLENGVRYEEQFSPAEDYALWLRLIKYTDFHILPDVLFKYRFHANNTSKTQKTKMERATCALHALAKNAYPDLYEEFLLRATHTAYVRLFGIPVLKIVRQGGETRCLLFYKIPVLVFKSVTKLKIKGAV